MTFKLTDGTRYEIDPYGVIHEVNPPKFTYDAKYSGCYDRPEYVMAADKLQAMRYAYACGAHGEDIRSITDVGYGNGSFLRVALKQIPNVYGLDITGVKVPYGAKKIDEFRPCDVICFHDVLEHIPDLSFVSSLKCKTLVISLPYCHYKIKGKEWFENWYHRKSGEHVHHFDADSLRLFMKSKGWEMIGCCHHEDIVRIPRDEGLTNILTAAFTRKDSITFY